MQTIKEVKLGDKNYLLIDSLMISVDNISLIDFDYFHEDHELDEATPHSVKIQLKNSNDDVIYFNESADELRAFFGVVIEKNG